MTRETIAVVEDLLAETSELEAIQSERLLVELGFELWIWEPAKIRAKRLRKQKTDRRDVQLLLELLEGGRFPRLWVPSPENRDLRQLLWHRHRLVQMRTRIMNQLQAVALNEGLRRQRGLWSQNCSAEGGDFGASCPLGKLSRLSQYAC